MLPPSWLDLSDLFQCRHTQEQSCVQLLARVLAIATAVARPPETNRLRVLGMNIHNAFIHESDVNSLTSVSPRGQDFSLLVAPPYSERYHDGQHEAFTTRYLRAVLPHAGIFVDVGARYGFFSLLAASANKDLRIVSVEPVAEIRDVLIRNLERFSAERRGAPRFTVCDRAISDAHGTRPSPLSSDHSAVLETTSLDALLSTYEPVPLVIKIDTEGHELAVLRGVTATLDRFENVTLVVKIHPGMLGLAGAQPEQLLAQIETMGFAAFIVDEARGLSFRVSPRRDWARFIQSEGHANLICMRKARALSICFFAHGAGATGAERTLAELVKDLVGRHGALCTVLATWAGPLEALIRDAGGSFVVAPYSWWCYLPRQGKDGAAALNEALPGSLAKCVRDLVPLVADVDPDIICTQTGVIPWGAVAAAALGKPHIWSVCEYGELDHGLRFVPSFPAIAADIERCSDFIFFNTADIRNSLFPTLPEERWDVLTRYLELELPWEVASLAQEAPRPHQLVIVGTVAPTKGQADAVAAVAILKERGLPVELLVVGGGEADDLAELRQRVTDLGLTNDVRFIDFMMNPFPLVTQADVALVCSRREAFGRVAVEAMLLGKPVVYAAAGGIAAYMRDGETGLGYPPGDTTALADRIETLLRDEPLRTRLGAAGQTFARATFTRDGFSGKFHHKAMELRGTPARAQFPASLWPVLQTHLANSAKLSEALGREKAQLQEALSEAEHRLSEVSAAADQRGSVFGTALAEREHEFSLANQTTAGIKASLSHRLMAPFREIYRPIRRARASPLGKRLRAMLRHPLNSRKRKLFRAGETVVPSVPGASEVRRGSPLGVKLRVFARHPFSSTRRKLYRAQEQSWRKPAGPDQRAALQSGYEPEAERVAGGVRASMLETLTPFDEVIASRRFRRPRHEFSRASLFTLLRDSISPDTVTVISLSQDNYRAIVGGIQLCLHIEEAAYKRRRAAYIHLHPYQPLPCLAPETPAANYQYGLTLNGEFIGHVAAADVIDAVALQNARGVRHELVIHTLMGHPPELVVELARAAGIGQGVFWIHDYFSLCPSYTLMRNSVSYCAAPPSSSPACQICYVGTYRPEHLLRLHKLFSEIPFTVVAPSATALDVWRASTNLPAQAAVVHEHCDLMVEPASASRPTIDAPHSAEPLRVAFLGFPNYHKGWSVFCDIARLCGRDELYAFYHLGRLKSDEAPTQIRFLEAEATTRDWQAMSKAVSQNEIDVAFLCSVWPETYNFTALEALAGGALIVTLEGSGNIAALVRKHGCGLVFANEAALKEAFVSGGLVTQIRDMQSKGTPRYTYTFSDMSAGIRLQQGVIA